MGQYITDMDTENDCIIFIGVTFTVDVHNIVAIVVMEFMYMYSDLQWQVELSWAGNQHKW